MKDRFIWDETYVSCDYVIDNQENKSIPIVEVVDLLNKQDQRIAELEAKLEEVEGQYAYECECNKQLVELQEENEKLQNKIDAFNYAKNTVDYWACRDKKVEELQEQLKNAIVPKFKVGQEVYYIKDNAGTIKPAEILEVRYNGKRIIYELEYLDNIQEEKYIFATETEAQKYLEEHK